MPSRQTDPGVDGRPDPTLLQVVDALILFDTPLLDQRFQEAIAMHGDAEVRASLAELPARVAEGSRLTRRAAVEWERTRGALIDEEFRSQAERFLLEAHLEGAEAQIRLKTFMARNAPTDEVRRLIDAAVEAHRELAHVLREALVRIRQAPEETPGPAAPFLGSEAPHGDLRTQVEQAIRHMRGAGKTPRLLALSANALRHLRDQGLFHGGETTVLGVPVQVDFAWPGATFALASFDSASLEEIVEDA